LKADKIQFSAIVSLVQPARQIEIITLRLQLQPQLEIVFTSDMMHKKKQKKQQNSTDHCLQT
jgi:hypothetical protein